MQQEALLNRELRANPQYELASFDRLDTAARDALAGLTAEPGFYGVLRPRLDSGLGVKSVDCDTALLYLTLSNPGRLPSFARAALGESAARIVAQLVADRILEVEHDGAFVTGAAAYGPESGANAVSPSVAAGAADRCDGHLAALSRAALRYGQNLAMDDPLELSLRLYAYNRRPLTPAWGHLLPDAPAVERYLGIAAGGAHRKLLASEWAANAPVDDVAWLSWRSRRTPALSSGAAATYKLYVSPATERLGEDFGSILAGLAAAGAPPFKVGSDASGLLRPDKIVAYFPTFERLAEAAGILAERLRGMPAQGVPFTAEIAGGGLLSWGVDPPPGESRLLGVERESWRLWLTHCLARALLDARASLPAGDGEPAAIEPWRFAVERLELEGVNTNTWAPRGALWREV
jgi:hypothetical protein